MSAPDAWQRRETPLGGTTPRDFRSNPQRRLRRFIERWIVRREPVRSVLDVGANAGIEAWRLRAAGYRGSYAGVDSNRKALASARRELRGLGGVSFVCADARRLPFPDREFDCVLAKDLLEHLPHYRTALSEMARTARRTVILGIFLPLARRERIERHPDGYWLNRYARGPFLSLIVELGFEAVNSKTIWRMWRREQVLICARRDRRGRPGGSGGSPRA